MKVLIAIIFSVVYIPIHYLLILKECLMIISIWISLEIILK